MEREDGRVLRDDEEIRKEISRFYKDLFSLDLNERPFVEGLNWCAIDHNQANWLERPFELDVIKTLFLRWKEINPPVLMVSLWNFSKDVKRGSCQRSSFSKIQTSSTLFPRRKGL